MRRIALMNQKGGVGKTTSTVNLAAALARTGLRVAVVDLDPQAHSTTHLGIHSSAGRPTLHHVLCGTTSLDVTKIDIAPNLSLFPSSLDLAGAELELAAVVGRELILRDKFDASEYSFDYILFDCPPSLGVLTINALCCAEEVMVPCQPHFLALHGLSKLFETVQLVSKRLNPRLGITGIILCLYESGTRLSAEVAHDLAQFLDQSRGANHQGKAWARATLFQTRIRRNIRLAEAASFGKSIFEHAPDSPGARDYETLASEIVAQTMMMKTNVAA